MTEQFQTVLALVAEEPSIALSSLRAAVNDMGRALRNRTSERLEEAGRQKLKSIKRKVVMGTQAGSEDELFSNQR
jgi:UDP-N-acetylglucosamine enolpyruvyl transferase